MAKNNPTKDALIKRINRKLITKQQKVQVGRDGVVMLIDKLNDVEEHGVDLLVLAQQLGVSIPSDAFLNVNTRSTPATV